MAYIVVDNSVRELIRATGSSESTKANSLKELFDVIDISADTAIETVEAYNAACDPSEFEPDAFDGNTTEGVEPPKTN